MIWRTIKTPSLSNIIEQYKSHNQSVYNTCFINNKDRSKAFRSIRRGILQVIDDIKCGKFGNDFKGSSLEFVLTCITEQKKVFEGAAHPFHWKPKLRIPDIYENEKNKIAFGQFLENVLKATNEEQIVKEIIHLDDLKVKGTDKDTVKTIKMIDLLWFQKSTNNIIRAFEVEKSTSIYSGILR